MNPYPVTNDGAGAARPRRRGPANSTAPAELAALGWLVEQAAALLTPRPLHPGEVLDGLADAAADAGLHARREQPLLAGGTAELLIGPADPADAGQVAVILAEHGATDALRGRLRRLAAHREIAAVLVVSTRPRHRTLADEVTAVPVRVVVVDGPSARPAPPSPRGPVRTSRVPQPAG